MTPRRRAELLQLVLDVWELHGGVWTQGSYGRVVANGAAVSWSHKAARGFCLVGAIERIGVERELVRDELHELYRALEIVAGVDGTFALERWNDQPWRTYGDVRELICSTIEWLRGAAFVDRSYV